MDFLTKQIDIGFPYSTLQKLEFAYLAKVEPKLLDNEAYFRGYCTIDNDLNVPQPIKDLYNTGNRYEKIKSIMAMAGIITMRDQNPDISDATEGIFLSSALEDTKTLGYIYQALYGYTPSAPANEVYETVNAISNNIPGKLLSEYIGWIAGIGKGKKPSTSPTGFFSGYTNGELSSNTMVSELSAIASGDLLAMSRMADSSLTKVLRKRENSKPGNVILMRDESGSMKHISGGIYTRHQQAVAFEIALAGEVVKKKRKMVTYRWSTEFNVDRFDWVNANSSAINAHLTSFQNGGSTELQPALNIASRDINGDADILIITDGKLGNQVITRSDNKHFIWVITLGNKAQEYSWADMSISSDTLLKSDSVVREILSRR